MVEQMAFLDLSDSDKSRQEIRRMEKMIRENEHYVGKIGKVFFFRFNSDFQKHNFFAQIMAGIRQNGDRAVIHEARYNLRELRK